MFKIALPRYRRVSYKKLSAWAGGEKLVIDSLQTTNFTFPAVTCWKNIVRSFSVPLWCNEHPPGQTSFLGCLSLRVPGHTQPTNLGRANVLTLSEQQYFVFDTASQSTKWQEALEILGVISPCLRLCACPKRFFFGGESCACFPNNYTYFDLQVIYYG